MALSHFRAASKRSPRHRQKEWNTLLWCNAYTVPGRGRWGGLSALFFHWFRLQTWTGPAMTEWWRELFTRTLYAMCRLVSLDLMAIWSPPRTREIKPLDYKASDGGGGEGEGLGWGRELKSSFHQRGQGDILMCSAVMTAIRPGAEILNRHRFAQRGRYHFLR